MATKSTLSNTITGMKFQTMSDIPNLQLWLDASDTTTLSAGTGVTKNSFIDSSSNNFAVTRTGTPGQGTFTPFPTNGAVYNPTVHGGSCYFSGNGNYLYGSNNISFDVSLGNSIFTFECWVYLFNNSNGAFFGIGSGAAYGNSIALYYNGSTNKFTFSRGNSSGSNPVSIVTSRNYPTQNWYHVAVTKTSDGIHTLYINGVADGTQMYTSNLAAGAATFIVNGLYDNNGLGNSGSVFYISNLRFSSILIFFFK